MLMQSVVVSIATCIHGQWNMFAIPFSKPDEISAAAAANIYARHR
jgi:hypothetical protein